MEFKNIHTRFREYQMTVKGSSFSYWESDNDKFTLGEARYNDDNKASIHHELSKCGKETIDNLYISSWEMDHCTASELEDILKELKPSSIYAPLYEPDPKKENQVNSKKLVDGYAGPPKPYRYNGKNLNTAKPWTYTKTYHNQKIGENANDNSLVCLWRTGNFSVLSVGDLESATLSKQIEDSTIYPETDVFILSHHGSSSNFNTVNLIKALNPRVCLALVDRKNQYGHPDPTVEKRARDHSKYISTKDGDIIIETDGSDNQNFKVYNYISSGDTLESIEEFEGKKVIEFRKAIKKGVENTVK